MTVTSINLSISIAGSSLKDPLNLKRVGKIDASCDLEGIRISNPLGNIIESIWILV